MYRAHHHAKRRTPDGNIGLVYNTVVSEGGVSLRGLARRRSWRELFLNFVFVRKGWRGKSARKSGGVCRGKWAWNPRACEAFVGKETGEGKEGRKGDQGHLRKIVRHDANGGELSGIPG